jgi:hypothetical protein
VLLAKKIDNIMCLPADYGSDELNDLRKLLNKYRIIAVLKVETFIPDIIVLSVMSTGIFNSQLGYLSTFSSRPGDILVAMGDWVTTFFL